MIYSWSPLFSKSLKLTSLSVTAPISIDPALRASDKVDIRQEPEKPREVSHVDRLVRGIIDGFREGRYQPGERLVAADLAAQFDVSRAPVREALAILVGEGVVEIKKNYGARIRTFSVDELVEIMEVTEAALVLGDVVHSLRPVCDPVHTRCSGCGFAAARRRGLVLFWFLSRPQGFRLAPPLNAPAQELDRALTLLIESLDDVQE